MANSGSPYTPQIKLGFSLMSITVHKFLHIIDQIQTCKDLQCKNPAFEIDYDEIDFENLIENSKLEKKFIEKGEHQYSAITIGGKSLIQICIENESVIE